MFEGTKSYDQGEEEMYKRLNADAFIHDRNKTHRIMQFLQEAVMKVTANNSIWILWYGPIPEAERATVNAKTDFVDMEVDEGQWIKSKLAKVNESDNDSSSEADADKKSTSSTSSGSTTHDKNRRVRLKKNPRDREAERRSDREREEEQLRQVKHAKVKISAEDSGARGSNDPAPRTKRTVRDSEGPTSPKTIRKATRINWNTKNQG